jgi:DNA adenine methylase
MSNDVLIKWSGSKGSQSKRIIDFFPKIEKYFEPFVGGGSVLLELLKSDIKVDEYIISDINVELIGIYNLVKNNPLFLIETYKKHHKEFNSSNIQHRKYYFNEVRAKFNKEKSPEDFYFITRTTTNGLIRYNKKGEFNSSCHFSRPGQDPISVEKTINKYNILFNENNITFKVNNYLDINPSKNDLIYCDPPYFKTKAQYFGNFDNIQFINWFNKLNCKCILSYDGLINNETVKHITPKHIRHEYLISGNSSFRRILGNSADTMISESLYLNF